MKISKTIFPILGYLENKNLPSFNVKESLSREIKFTTNEEPKYRDKFNEYQRFLNSFSTLDYKISYFSQTIRPQINSVGDRFSEFIGELPDCKGLFLIPDGSNNISAFYKYTSANRRFQFIDLQDDKVESFGILEQMPNELKEKTSDSGEIIVNPSLYISLDVIPEFDLDKENPPPPYRQRGATVAKFLMSHLLFYHLVDTDIIILSESASYKRKANIHGEDLSTKSKLKIELVDSNWFRTIIRTEGFAVKGHFRLQPVGEGRLKRKLIWINDFQKHGYKLEAKLKKLEE